MKGLKQQIETERAEKDRFFKFHPQSPLPLTKRAAFTGLAYYPVNAGLRFELELHEHNEKRRIEIQDSKGGAREFIRWGEFRFEINGKEYTLQVYKSGQGEETFWVPFKDKTSGKETYGAGRYIDLEPSRHKISKEKWILDFNQAYNPFCAYSEDYVCPFIPPENWLESEIKAGEKYSSPERKS
ncbi:MAG: DUF1684 domain-containing protein [Candidatus Aenigmarchaeota archaeon]|nr:DUF1684 domain-containing protein [Candidatus Aenigmarchaeota archaeon]